MLIRSLASNYLKSIRRSRFGEMKLAMKALTILFVWMPLYLYAMAGGLFGGLLARELFFDVDMAAIASRFALYFFIVWGALDILFRPQIALPLFPYLPTPIGRRKVALFYQAISVFGQFNLLPFLFVFFFWISNFLVAGVPYAWGWMLLFLTLSAGFHFLVNLLRMSLARRYLPVICTLLVVAGLAAIEWRYDISTLSGLSMALFGAMLEGAFWPLAAALVASGAALYVSTGQVVRSLYVDNSILSRSRAKAVGKGLRHSFADGMLAFEWKLIWRNKRPRMLMFLSGYFVLFGGWIAIGMSSLSDVSPTEMTMGLLMPVLGCLQFMMGAFNFRSTFYDGLMSRPVPIHSILTSSFSIANIALFGTLGLIAIIFAIIKGFGSLFFVGCMLLYGLALKYTVPYTWVLDARRLELNGQVFGVVAARWDKNSWITGLWVLPGVLVPFLLVLLLPGMYWGSIAIALLGLAGLLWRRKWIDGAVKRLERKRYLILEEFRKR